VSVSGFYEAVREELPDLSQCEIQGKWEVAGLKKSGGLFP
jgi:hypothetical protein